MFFQQTFEINFEHFKFSLKRKGNRTTIRYISGEKSGTTQKNIMFYSTNTLSMNGILS